MNRRPLPDSEERREDRRNQRIVRWTIFLIVLALTVTIALAVWM